MNKQDTFERIVVDSEGAIRSLHVVHDDATKAIGRGTRSQIQEVVVLESGDNPVPMAMKKFEHPDMALRAMEGYQALKAGLPPEELEHLIPEFYVDYAHSYVFETLLNKDKWVISMGGNESKDRTYLREHTLKTIPNFHAFVARLFDAVEASAHRGTPIGPDVYFFSIDHQTCDMDYIYADTESAAGNHLLTTDQTPVMNLYWLSGALNHFLHECVENPERYLDRVRQEVIHRIYDYSGIDDRVERTAGDLLKDFSWPQLSAVSRFKSVVSWFGTLAKRQVVSAWKS